MKYKNIDEIMSDYVVSHGGDKDSDLKKFRRAEDFHSEKKTYYKLFAVLWSFVLFFVIVLPVGLGFGDRDSFSYDELSATNSFELVAEKNENDDLSISAGSSATESVFVKDIEGIEPIKEIMLPSLTCKKINMYYLSKNKDIICVEIDIDPSVAYFDSIKFFCVFEGYNIQELDYYKSFSKEVEYSGKTVLYNEKEADGKYIYSIYYGESEKNCFVDIISTEKVAIDLLLKAVFYGAK